MFVEIVRISYALETHLHNDFVSGARELAAQTGCQVGASAAGVRATTAGSILLQDRRDNVQVLAGIRSSHHRGRYRYSPASPRCAGIRDCLVASL